MLPRVLLRSAAQAGPVRRHMSASAVLCRPEAIQQLFVDKIRDYAKQSKAAGGKLVGASPEVQKNLTDRLESLDRQYGATGAAFLQFPTFTFKDQPLEPIGISVDKKAPVEEAVPEEIISKETDREYWEL